MTTGDDWARVTELFDQLLPVSVEERESALRAEAPATREQVQALLGALEREGGRFAGCALELLDEPGVFDLLGEAAPGSRVGPYQVVREVGRGGMGVVYEAFRADDDYRKRVALKLMGLGAHSGAVMRRFRRERRILAQLEHPNIAALLDGGLTPQGLPFFALEFVEGMPIDEDVTRRALPLAERIQLIRQVCGALQYAHQRLVVHRDLKPGNILVGPDGTVKLLDFGVAKLLQDDDLSGGEDRTEVGAQPYTPGYASPEQLLGEPLTTACDIHGLGIVLYQVLTGRHPFRSDGATPALVRRRILDEPPPSCGLGRDLDAILELTLRKVPGERYPSAAALAEDLRRYLEGQPLVARPGTRGERLGKFVRRHRAAVLTTGLMVAALILGAAATWWQARRAEAQRGRAELFAGFVAEMLSAPDPSQRGRDARVVDILAAAKARLELDAVGDPVARAAIQRTLGTTYMRLGVHDTARVLLEAALAGNRAGLGESHPETARSELALADLHAILGEVAPAENLYRTATLALRREGPTGMPDLARGLTEYGNLLFNAGRLEEAGPVVEEALRLMRRSTPTQHQTVVNALNTLGMVQEHSGDAPGAKTRYREAIAARSTLTGPLATSLVGPLSNLANVLKLQDSLPLADSLQALAVANAREAFGERHTTVAATLTGLGDIRRRSGNFAAAEADLRSAVEVLAAALPPDHLQHAPALSLLGLLQCERDRPAEGEPHLRRALEIRRAGLPAGHWFIHNLESALSVCLRGLGRGVEAAAMARSGFEGLSKALGADHPRTREAAARLEATGAAR